MPSAIESATNTWNQTLSQTNAMPPISSPAASR